MGGILIGIAILFLPMFHPVRAEYVLPYPSYMPGNKLYTVSKALDVLKNYWSWGDIAQFRYHLSLSDKYLIEAKTLFEYKQYFLGSAALVRSDAQLEKTPKNLLRARGDGKDTGALRRTLKDASLAHAAVLARLLSDMPADVTWAPEKSEVTTIPLRQLLQKSLDERISVASIAASL